MELEEALRIVIAHLDIKMEEQPSRKLADVSNFLEDVLAEEV